MKQLELYERLDNDHAKLMKFLEDKGCHVHLFEQDGMVNAEVESWTDAGVDMIIALMPFNLHELEQYCDTFDIDEEIDISRQDETYRNMFSISQRLEDFTKWINNLKRDIKEFNGEKVVQSESKTTEELLEDWLNSSTAYLSTRTDYAKGYKAGIEQAKQIVSDLINNR